jgi:hypothetical protein
MDRVTWAPNPTPGKVMNHKRCSGLPA